MSVDISRFFSRKGGDIDMTKGSIPRLLINFSIPLLIGNLFQQLYNVVDTWIVGNYVSDLAFSAVGSIGPITNLLIGFFTGLASGAGVVISRYYGARRYDKVRDAVHTSMTVTYILGIVFTILGIMMTPIMLRFMKTPETVYPESQTYLIIYFAGIFGLMVYNMGSGILRAVGDSVKPFIFLVVSAFLNILLDLLFVLIFHMGVAGVAYATIISQGISAILTVFELVRTESCVKLTLLSFRIEGQVLKQILSIGIPSAVQIAITSFSNIFVQSYINYFGPDFMGGWTAYAKIDQFILLPMQSLALASTTFVGQNLGIHNEKRAKEGVHIAFFMSAVSTVVLMIPVMIFAPQLTYFFNKQPNVVQHGAFLLRFISPFYVLCCVNQIYAGALRGAGNSKIPMVIMLGSFVAFRQLYLRIGSQISNTVYTIAFAYPAGWILASTITILYFYKVGLRGKRVASE